MAGEVAKLVASVHEALRRHELVLKEESAGLLQRAREAQARAEESASALNKVYQKLIDAVDRRAPGLIDEDDFPAVDDGFADEDPYEDVLDEEALPDADSLEYTRDVLRALSKIRDFR